MNEADNILFISALIYITLIYIDIGIMLFSKKMPILYRFLKDRREE